MWKPIKSYDSRDAHRLWDKLNQYVNRIEETLAQAKTTCKMADLTKYNNAYLGTQARVSRILSVRVFFGEHDRQLLDDVVDRARTALDNHRLMKAEDVGAIESPGNEPDGMECEDSYYSSDEDDDLTCPSSPFPTGDNDEHGDDPVAEAAWRNPEPPVSPAFCGGGRERLFETPQTLRSDEPESPTATTGSPSWMSELAKSLPPTPPETAGAANDLPEVDAEQFVYLRLPMGTCAAPDPSPDPPEDPPDVLLDETIQVGTENGLEGKEGDGKNEGEAGKEGDLDKELTPEIIKMMLQKRDLSVMKDARPSEHKRFSGKDDLIDIDAHIGFFELIAAQFDVSTVVQFAEFPNWFSGTALDICRLYDKEEDLALALNRLKRHLKREFSRNKASLSSSLNRVLVGEQIDKMDTEGFSDLIEKLEDLQTKAVRRNKPRAFGNFSIEQILTKKLAFAVEPWSQRCSKLWADKFARSPEGTIPCDIDDEVSFNEFLTFLRRLQKRYFYEKRYNERKSAFMQQKHEAAVAEGKKGSHTKTASSKKVGPKNWSCPFCEEPYTFHLPEDCNAFKSWPVKERIKAIKNNHRCLNCLRLSHLSKNCTRKRCSECMGGHHTLLHKTDSDRNF